MRIKKALFLGTLCTAVSGMSLFAQAGVSYAKSAEKTTEAASSEEAESEEETSEEVTYPITIEHAFGETVIESKPERIATIGWENQDTPLALGVAPVGVSAANYGMVTDNNLHPWTDEAFADLGVEKPVVFDDVDGLDFEQISDCNPDVILAAYSGMTQEDYDTLSQIAPVIPYKEKAWQTSWREQTIENAEGMGCLLYTSNLKKSEELFEKLSSVYQKKQIFLKINSSASAIILGQYSRLLGDIMNYEKALYIDSVNLKYELNDFNLIHIENLLYNQAWAYYEIDREQNNQKIQRKFWAAQRFAEFNRKEELINLLKMRENKYLKDD